MLTTHAALPASAVRQEHVRITIAAALAAICIPTLLAPNYAPSATFLNQAAALTGWSLLLLWLVWPGDLSLISPRKGLAAFLLALSLVGASAAGSWWMAALPRSLALSALGMLAATLVAACAGAAIGPSRRGPNTFSACCVALTVAGVLSVAIATVQIFIPEWVDGVRIAAGSSDGRASGNLRQPNHLSSLLLWTLIAALWLFESGRMRRKWAMALVAVTTFGIVLTASRTGVAGIALLALRGLLDRRMSRGSRSMHFLVPLVYLLCWGGLSLSSHLTHQAIGAETRIVDTADSPNSRLHIWANALTLILRHPWAGVGFGEFNFAWSLTVFPHRPVAFFDHTHNLPLQLAVELGLPLAIVVMSLLLYALWRAFAAGRDAEGAPASMMRAAFMMVIMILLHSLLEYPLWYAYFLLPTAFFWGLCLGAYPSATAMASAESERMPPPVSSASIFRPRRLGWLALGSFAMLVGGVSSVLDYTRVVAIFEADQSKPLAQRIADGEHSWFFAHHAYYAAATITEHPSQVMPAFKVATHYLLDTRLMMAWANALNESGQVDKARYIAQRLREFRNDDAAPFFAPCDEPAPQGRPQPFQCTPPSRTYDYRDFR